MGEKGSGSGKESGGVGGRNAGGSVSGGSGGVLAGENVGGANRGARLGEKVMDMLTRAGEKNKRESFPKHVCVSSAINH